MIKVYRYRLCDYLMLHGYYPEREEYGVFYFRRCKEIEKLLDDYDIICSFYW